MKYSIVIIATMLLAGAAEALTLKTGQVLGSDGQVYQGASPETRQQLINKVHNGGEIAGVSNNSVYVVVGETITFLPLAEIQGLTDATIKTRIGDRVVQNVTGLDSLTFADLEAARLLSQQTGLELSEIIKAGGLDGLQPGLLAEIQKVSAETGIGMQNLLAVSTIMDSLPEDKVAELSADLEELIAEGFAEQLDEILTAAQEEGVLNNLLRFNSLEECQAAGADNCEAADRFADQNDPNAG